jgi:hypothetical protein
LNGTRPGAGSTLSDLTWTNATRKDVAAARDRLAARGQDEFSVEDRIIVTEEGLASRESVIGELIAARRA